MSDQQSPCGRHDSYYRDGYDKGKCIPCLENDREEANYSIKDLRKRITELEITLAWYAENNSWKDYGDIDQHHPKIRDCGMLAALCLASKPVEEMTTEEVAWYLESHGIDVKQAQERFNTMLLKYKSEATK